MITELETQQNAMLSRLEAEYKKAPKKFKDRVEAWMLRLQGYPANEIAIVLKVSVPTVYNHLTWAKENLPSAIDGAEDFIRISYERLEVQYRQLSDLRAQGDVQAHRVSIGIIDQQAQLLGIYTMKLDLTAKVNYAIEGVDMGQV